MNQPIPKTELPQIKHIIAVASGKGGVGKSTVASGLAVALARNGFKVGLVDADIYGPSIPRMFGIEDARPEVTTNGNTDLMFPIEKFGIQIMSIGFFVDKGQSLIWRGPMAANAITQLIENTNWNGIDYLVIDFPPGTGDIQLTILQKYNLTGAVVVTTPQEIALNDARKATAMLTNNNLKVPLLGIVENMAWFTPAPHPDEKYFIFGQGGGQTIADEFGTRLIGQIPLVMELGEAAEKGQTAFHVINHAVVSAFETMASAIAEQTA